MRYYITTSDTRYVDALRELKAMAGARYRFFKAKIEALSFDELGMHEFGVPCFFYKLCEDQFNPERKGPAVDGFKGGDRVYENGKYYFKYAVRGRGKAFYEQLTDGAPAVPEELTKVDFYRKPDINTVFCMRLGLPDGVFNERAILFGQVFLLHNDTMVACSLPFRDDDSKESAPVVIPDGFTEVTERALQAEIKKHNEALAE